MPQDQKFCSRLYSGQDRADADFPALVATEAVAVFITGIVRTHYRNLSMKLAKSKRRAARSVSGPIPEAK